MTSENSSQDAELRRIASEVISELRESLRAANAEAVTRGQLMMEERVGDRSSRHSAFDIWSRLRNDPTAFVQGDYGLLRNGLGRRARPGGPVIDFGLEVDLTGEVLLVLGQPLKGSVGLVVRWRNADGEDLETVVPHTVGDGSHIIEYDGSFGESPLRVISFDATSITGFGVSSGSTPFNGE